MKISEYDQRQYQLMVKRLRDFENGVITLASLINDIDALLRSLEEPDEAWVDLFWIKWFSMEEVYSVALDRGDSRLRPEEQSVIKEAVRNLKDLLQQKVVPSPLDDEEG